MAGSGSAVVGYAPFGYPGYSYGAPRFGYPFFGFSGLPGYGYGAWSGYPGYFLYDVPLVAPEAAVTVAPNPAPPRVLTTTEGQIQAEKQARAEIQDESTPRVVTGGEGGRASGGRGPAAPPIYRGPPPVGGQEGDASPMP